MIVLSLMERDPAKVTQHLLAPPPGADAIEVRLDALRRCEPPLWFPGSAASSRPVIATCRRVEEGGLYRRSEKKRHGSLLAAARAGVTYVDIEFGSPLMDLLDEIAPAKVILSHHDPRRTPAASDLYALYRRMAKVPGVAAIKIVTTARKAADMLEIRRLLARVAGKRVMLAAFAMGEAGVASRILAPLWGSWATYVSLRPASETAAGQIALGDALDLYRIEGIDEETRLTGITGWPVSHSLSPVMHNAAFHHHGINFRYLPFPARRAEESLGLARALKIRGLSVTSPHKAAAFRMVRNKEPQAREIGAINTIVNSGKSMLGFNTDIQGLLRPLRERIDPAGKVAVILGAGGAARAIAWALTRAGANVVISSRRERAGREVAARFGARYVPPRRLPKESYDILVNATPAGMDGRSMAAPARAVKGSLVADLVYRPLVTPLLRTAQEKGIPTLSGLDVLLNQGIEQYALFTGREAPEAVMRRALHDAVAARAAATAAAGRVR